MKTVAFFDAKSYDRESFKRFEDEDINIRFFENKLNADTVTQRVAEIISVTVFFYVTADFSVGCLAGYAFFNVQPTYNTGVLYNSVCLFKFIIGFAYNESSGHIAAVSVVNCAEL